MALPIKIWIQQTNSLLACPTASISSHASLVGGGSDGAMTGTLAVCHQARMKGSVHGQAATSHMAMSM